MIVKNSKQIELYSSYLKAVASLSRLFSLNEIPFLYYRVVENIFCKSFGADNLSRDDSAYDARAGRVAWGIKTFISSAQSQKIAEFNTHSQELKALHDDEDLVIRIAQLRNERIYFANRIYKVNEAYYHCVTRQKNILKIFEESYSPINIEEITKIKKTRYSVSFEDNSNKYSFNFPKSTLFKKFYVPQDTRNVDIEILENPFDILVEIINTQSIPAKPVLETFIILPLYSNSPRGKVVHEKSGLNAWNVGSKYNEVYIPIPKYIRKEYHNFFPAKDTPFNLMIPSGIELSAKVCQENNKALMTNPNDALGKWLLREALQLEEGEKLTYAKLQTIGIDSVKITKMNENNYRINFSKVSSYERFVRK